MRRAPTADNNVSPYSVHPSVKTKAHYPQSIRHAGAIIRRALFLNSPTAMDNGMSQEQEPDEHKSASIERMLASFKRKYLVIGLILGVVVEVALVANNHEKLLRTKAQKEGKAVPSATVPPSASDKIPLYFAYHISDKLDQAGGPFTEQNAHPMVDAAIINAKWALAEPERGTFDWSLLDEKIAEWVGQSDKKIIIKFSPYGADPVAGEEGDGGNNDVTPAWVYGNGIPKITFTLVKQGKERTVSVPKVWDPDFYPPYEEFIQGLGKKYNNDPRVAGVIIGIGHNSAVIGQGSKSGGEAFEAAGWTLSSWEAHIREVTRISKKHLSKPLFMIKTNDFLNKYSMKDTPEVTKRVFKDAALLGISPLLGGMAPELEKFNDSFNPELVRYLATLDLPAGYTIGFYDDWPLWVPPKRSNKCPGPTCGRDFAGFNKEFEYVFDVWDSINRKYPIFFAFQEPETEATNTNGPKCAEGGNLENCFYEPVYTVAAKWLLPKITSAPSWVSVPSNWNQTIAQLCSPYTAKLGRRCAQGEGQIVSLPQDYDNFIVDNCSEPKNHSKVRWNAFYCE